MRKLLKVLLPVLIDFGIFWVVVHYNTPAHPMKLVEIGNGNLYSLMAYFHLFGYLLLADGILTQYLIVVPLWDRGLVKGYPTRVATFICFAVVCVAFAGSISYIIWDPTEGRTPLFTFWFYLTEIQFFYWFFNFIVLLLIDRRKFAPQVPEPVEIESPV
ncbi:hypothetical protein [Mucilaginibacter sp. SP1R1]|uniref:hypothetical protein n=1 Tax=Mucilaginibacter sp. SP1R1 TaxID=2723091 RepID=UPI0016182E0C|nr:hypothetical protein [Mucilaginibacter sp. SP1R1]MBB6149724.1 hypothetical protein [Mucilaginibacter sp. SP1R1]